MRIFIFLGSLLLITFASFSQSGEKSKVEVGIYKLGKLTVNDGKRDSILPGINLIKMYTPSHFAFASLWNNSYVTYGIASYTQENKKIAQHFFYMTGSLDTVK